MVPTRHDDVAAENASPIGAGVEEGAGAQLHAADAGPMEDHEAAPLAHETGNVAKSLGFDGPATGQAAMAWNPPAEGMLDSIVHSVADSLDHIGLESTFEALTHSSHTDADGHEHNDGDVAHPDEGATASAAGPAPEDEPPPPRGGAPCETDVACGPRGVCTARDSGEYVCTCAALYTGADCSLPRTATRSATQESGPYLRALGYAGSITMTRPDTARLSQVRVMLHGKEDDKDGGNRTLGPVTKALLNVLPNVDAMEGKSKVAASCAVVGSSGSVLHFRNGKEIDAHDYIFRFNSAPTKRFESFVGSRTTHRITNTQNWAFRESDAEQILVHMRSQASLKALQRTVSVDRSVKMAAFSPSFVEYVGLAVNGFMATSGLYGILVASQVCEHLDLYGFQVSTAHGVCAYHYYDSCEQPANAQRDDIEWFVVRELVAMGAARFVEPCVEECHAGEEVCQQCKDQANFPKAVIKRRSKCPPCSTAYGGCRPGQGGRPIQHWAFTRRGTPPTQWRSLPIWQRPGGYTLQEHMANASALNDPAIASLVGGRAARRALHPPRVVGRPGTPIDVSTLNHAGAELVSGNVATIARHTKRGSAAPVPPSDLEEEPAETVHDTDAGMDREAGGEAQRRARRHRAEATHRPLHEEPVPGTTAYERRNTDSESSLARLYKSEEHRKGHGRLHREHKHHGR